MPRSIVQFTSGVFRSPSRGQRHVVFICGVVLSTWVFAKGLQQLFAWSMADERYTHVVFVPAIAALLALVKKNRDDRPLQPFSAAGALALSMGLIGYFVTPESAAQDLRMTVIAASILMSGVGLLLFCYGSRALKDHLLALVVLALAIPLPLSIVGYVEVGLQKASAEAVAGLFWATSTPVFREGSVFGLPRVNIEVARECSGIRSFIALMIGTLVMGRLLLRRSISVAFCLFLAIPIAVVKNAIRIAVLGWLGAYVSVDYLYGDLHHRGGPLFSIISVGLMALVILAVKHWEGGNGSGGDSYPSESEPQTLRARPGRRERTVHTQVS